MIDAIKKGPKTFKKRIASRKSTTRGRSERKLDLKKDRGIVQELTCDDDKKATSKKRKRTSFYQTSTCSTRFIEAQEIKISIILHVNSFYYFN